MYAGVFPARASVLDPRAGARRKKPRGHLRGPRRARRLPAGV